MELGGNAPFLVFDDADVNAAVHGAIQAKMRNGGEACTAANRFIVHESIASEFSQLLTDRMKAIKIGNGFDDGVSLGPMIDADQRNKVAEFVDDAVSLGARSIPCSTVPEGKGHFYSPTILLDVPQQARVWNEEIFGPVAPIFTFTNNEQAIAMANATDFGLVSYVYTRDLDTAVKAYEYLETGMVGVNTGIVSNPAAPFGGVKLSGLGREGGKEGMDEYLESKYVRLAI